MWSGSQVALAFSPESLHAIARRAVTRNTGVHGLKFVMVSYSVQLLLYSDMMELHLMWGLLRMNVLFVCR
jgi:ATP-dependent protease Clp ATPase subunit